MYFYSVADGACIALLKAITQITATTIAKSFVLLPTIVVATIIFTQDKKSIYKLEINFKMKSYL